MTLEPTASAPLPAGYDPSYTGLEEFDASDMVTPRLSIQHREGLFKDSLTNGTYSGLNVIILGLVKQRILWPRTMTEGDVPMCRSNDHKTGFVNINLTNKPADKQFPWPASHFDPSQQTLDQEGRVQLPCEGCNLKEWGSHPDGKKPWCAELFTLPVMYDPMETGNYVPALMSFQKTSLKPLRAYLSSFQRGGTPPFQVYTRIELDVIAFGSNPYSVPRFTMGQQTDQNEWREYAHHSRTMAEFLRADPRPEEEPEAQPAPSANQWGQQPQVNQNPWDNGQTQPPAPQWPTQQAAQQAPVQAQVVQPASQQAAPPQFQPPAPQQAAQEPAPAPVADPSVIAGGWAAQTAGVAAAPPQTAPEPVQQTAPPQEPQAQTAPVQDDDPDALPF